MTGQQILVGRVAMTTLLLLCAGPLASASRIQRPSQAVFDRMAIGAVLVSRLAVFALVFLVLRMPLRGDVPGYYVPQARAILSGLLPYRDFYSSYGPLHGYLDACLLKLWNSGLAIILFTILVEATLLPLWLKLGRYLVSEHDLRIASALYIASPFGIQFVCLDGQNTIMIGVLLTLAILLLHRDRDFAGGAAFGTSIVVVKFLSALYIPALLLLAPRRWRWLAGCAAVVFAGYSFVLLAHAPVLRPFASEGSLKTSGNLPYLIESICNVAISAHIWRAMLLCALGAVFIWMIRTANRFGGQANIHVLVFGSVALTLVLLIFSMKAQPAYLMMVLFPIYLLFRTVDRMSMFGLSCFSLAALVEPSVWLGLMDYPSATQLHQRMAMHETAPVLFLALQLPILAGYGWLLWKALARMSRPLLEGSADAEMGKIAGMVA